MHRAYEIVVGTSVEEHSNTAVAQATQRLLREGVPRSDGHVGEFRRLSELLAGSRVFDVNVYGDGGDDQQVGVGLCVSVERPAGVEPSTSDFETVFDEFEAMLDAHPSVETFERIHYEPSTSG